MSGNEIKLKHKANKVTNKFIKEEYLMFSTKEYTKIILNYINILFKYKITEQIKSNDNF